MQTKTNKTKQTDEAEDWEEIDKVFGEVYTKNKFWELREKVTIKDLENEVENQIEELKFLISDLKTHLKMSDNVSKKTQKNVPENEEPEKKMKKCGYPDCPRKFLFTNNTSKKYEEHLISHQQTPIPRSLLQDVYQEQLLQDQGHDQSLQLTLEQSNIVEVVVTTSEEVGNESESLLPSTQPSQPSQSQSENLLENRTQEDSIANESVFTKGLKEDAVVSTQNTLDVAGTKRQRKVESPDRNPELPKSRRVSIDLERCDQKKLAETCREISRLEKELEDLDSDDSEGKEDDIGDIADLWGDNVSMTDTMIVKKVEKDLEQREKEEKEEKKGKGEKSKEEKKKIVQFQAFDSTASSNSTDSTGSSVVEIGRVNSQNKNNDEPFSIVTDDTMIGSPVIDEEVERLKEELTKRNRTVSDLMQKEKATRAELAIEKIKVGKLREEVEKLKGKVGERDLEIHDLNGQVRDLAEGITNFTDQINALNGAIAAADDEKMELFNHSEKQKKQIQEKQEKIRERTRLLTKMNEEAKKQNNLIKKMKINEAVLKKNETIYKKKTEDIEKNLNNLQENQKRLVNSQQAATKLSDQTLQVNASVMAENARVKKVEKKCLDRNCFSEKTCGKSHAHKSRADKPCYFFNRGFCRNGRRCKDLHQDIQRKTRYGSESEAKEVEEEIEEMEVEESSEGLIVDNGNGNGQQRRVTRTQSESRSGYHGRGRGRGGFKPLKRLQSIPEENRGGARQLQSPRTRTSTDGYNFPSPVPAVSQATWNEWKQRNLEKLQEEKARATSSSSIQSASTASNSPAAVGGFDRRDFRINSQGEMQKKDFRQQQPQPPQHFTFENTSTMTQPMGQININNPNILQTQNNPTQPISRNPSSASTIPLSPYTTNNPHLPSYRTVSQGSTPTLVIAEEVRSPDCWDASNDFNNFGRGFNRPVQQMQMRQQPGLEVMGPRAHALAQGPRSNGLMEQQMMTQQEEIPEDVQKMMKEQKVKMARERMAENRESQLNHVQMEAEYQEVLMRERRELEARQQLLNQAEIGRTQGARPRINSYQPYQDQMEAVQNRLQEEEKARTAAYRDQFAQYQNQRSGGM